MVIETKKENLCINQLVARKESIVNVESDIIIPDIKPDILSAINTSGNVFLYKREILDGKIRIDGSINVYVMYMPDGDNQSVRGLNTNLDFTEMIDIDEARLGMSCNEDINIKLIECRVLNGRKINLRATLEVVAKVYSNENVELINEIENVNDIQMLSKTNQINSLIGEGNTKIYAKDNIKIDEIDNVAEVLKVDYSISDRETKISYNKVLEKAEFEVKILYLTEDNRVNSISGKIPVMGFIDIQNVTEENICDTTYKIRNVIVKPNSAEEHSIYVEAQIELNCCAFEIKEINIIQDIYSPVENINYIQKSINAMTGKQIKKDVVMVDENINVPEIANNRIYCVDITPHIINQNILNDKITYEGVLDLNFLFESDNNIKMDTRLAKLEFSFTVDAQGITNTNNIETNIDVKQNDFIIQNGGNIDCKIQLAVETNISNVISVNIINEINKEENKFYPEYSMVIYYVKKGDTLWNIAKKFKSTVKDIAKLNDIEDENNIQQGMQLFIPKFNSKKVA